MYDIISIGSATQDVFLSAEDFQIVQNKDFHTGQGICLAFGTKAEVHKIVFASGGGGTNAAVTFARQGYKAACIGVIGQDANGKALLDELRVEGVDAKYFQQHNDDITAYSVVLISTGGERTILSYKGEGTHFANASIPWDKLQSKWMYVNSLGGHLEIIESAVAWAQTNKVHLATNPGTKELALGLDKLAPLWKHFDVVGMNQEEAAKLVGVPFDQRDEIFKKMDEVIGGIFIMTMGQGGCAVSDGHFVYTAGIPDTPVVDRTGAGDAFHSAFVAEFIRSGNIEKAVQLASANSTSVVMQYGSKKGILKKGDIGGTPLIAVTKRAL